MILKESPVEVKLKIADESICRCDFNSIRSMGVNMRLPPDSSYRIVLSEVRNTSPEIAKIILETEVRTHSELIP